MNKPTKILAIIPARSGSKGIPNKNIKKLNGYPLIYYTIKAALGSRLIDRIIVSSDSEKILKLSKKLGVEAPFQRPKYASHDKSLAIDVIKHTLKWLQNREKYIPDAVIYLQPTSPLRTDKNINEAIDIFLKNKKSDSLISVVKPPHNFHPTKLMKLKNNYLVSLENKGWMHNLDRHQKRNLLYARNGPAILITKTDILLKGKLYGKKILPYIMDKISSIDIDDEIDFMLADFLIKK